MIRLFFLLSCFFILQNDETTITWNEPQKLTWQDFKGKPNTNSDAVAVTASGITFGYSLKHSDGEILSLETSIQADFYPNKSWYNKERADNHILGHEQLHFDITELHARKFRQLVSKLKPSKYLKRSLEHIHLEINKQLSQMQNKYDKESDFSRDFDEQARWQKFVTSELKKLNKYTYR